MQKILFLILFFPLIASAQIRECQLSHILIASVLEDTSVTKFNFATYQRDSVLFREECYDLQNRTYSEKELEYKRFSWRKPTYESYDDTLYLKSFMDLYASYTDTMIVQKWGATEIIKRHFNHDSQLSYVSLANHYPDAGVGTDSAIFKYTPYKQLDSIIRFESTINGAMSNTDTMYHYRDIKREFITFQYDSLSRLIRINYTLLLKNGQCILFESYTLKYVKNKIHVYNSINKQIEYSIEKYYE
jgi:hypothetical protein